MSSVCSFKAVLLPQNPGLNHRFEPCDGLTEMSSIALDLGVLGPQLVALLGYGLVGGDMAKGEL